MNKLVLKEYPNARTGEYIIKKYIRILEKKNQCDLKKILFATSLCSDGIHISTDFRRFFSRPFAMGGLGGFPHCGITGMSSFAQNIPEDGDAFIFYGPHIGITCEGKLGHLSRPGNNALSSSCCPALMLAVERLSQNYASIGDSKLDYQQITIERVLSPYREKILDSKIPIKEATEIFYSEIHMRINQLIDACKNEFRCRRIFMLGAVIINDTPQHKETIDIRNFEIIYIEKEQKSPNLNRVSSGTMPLVFKF